MKAESGATEEFRDEETDSVDALVTGKQLLSGSEDGRWEPDQGR